MKSLFPGDLFKGNATNATAKFDAFSVSALETSLPGTDNNAVMLPAPGTKGRSVELLTQQTDCQVTLTSDRENKGENTRL